MMDFSGIWVPLVTPFDAHGELDLPALARIVKHLSAQGVAGFVACGSTGEAAMLDESEHEAVLATTLAAATGKPVLMGLSGAVPLKVAQRARHLCDRHALSGFLLAAPAYVKPSQAGLIDYFHRVAQASPRPIVAYDVPARTGVRLEPATLRALAEHPRICALKDCSGERATAEAVLSDGRLALLGGNDDEMFDQLARGAVGAIAASAHLRTDLFVSLHRLMGDGHLTEARALWRALAPLTAALFAEPNPALFKALLAHDGRVEDRLRAPLQSASPASVTAAAKLLAAIESRWPTRGAG